MNEETQQDTATTFDADAFMNTQLDEAMATQLSSVPEGEYVAMVGDFDSSAFKTITTKNGPRAVLEIPFPIQDEALKVKLGREQVTHRETYWLDFIPGTGQLDSGPDKNVRLGQLRNALGQNVKGIPWSPSMLKGMGPLRIVIKTTSDKTDPEKKYTNITKYAKIS
jgi:hypothetical protein